MIILINAEHSKHICVCFCCCCVLESLLSMQVGSATNLTDSPLVDTTGTAAVDFSPQFGVIPQSIHDSLVTVMPPAVKE